MRNLRTLYTYRPITISLITVSLICTILSKAWAEEKSTLTSLVQVKLSKTIRNEIQELLKTDTETDKEGTEIANLYARTSLVELLKEEDMAILESAINILINTLYRPHNYVAGQLIIQKFDEMVKIHRSNTLGELKRWSDMKTALSDIQEISQNFADGNSSIQDLNSSKVSEKFGLSDQFKQIDPRLISAVQSRRNCAHGFFQDLEIRYSPEMISDQLVRREILSKKERKAEILREKAERRREERSLELSKGVYQGTFRKTLVKSMDRLMGKGIFSKTSYPEVEDHRISDDFKIISGRVKAPTQGNNGPSLPPPTGPADAPELLLPEYQWPTVPKKSQSDEKEILVERDRHCYSS